VRSIRLPALGITAAMVVAAALVLAACGGGSASPTTSEGDGGAPAVAGAVTIVDFGFEPVELSVPVGATVTWTNTGNATHTVKWSDGTPESAGLANGDTYQRTFDAVGSFGYVCGIHGSMAGTVAVSQ
jgi:plastocyanin